MKSSRTVLITGASSGIGKELAKLFAKDGYNLILIARSEDKLKDISEALSKSYNINIRYFIYDLSDISSPPEIFNTIRKENLSVDILVNNAGFGWFGNFVQMQLKDAIEMIQVNITSLTQLTKLFLPDMLEKDYGRILNVASTAAFQPGPLMAIYYATKAYVLSFSQALSEELKGTNISVTAFCPGPVETNFGERAGFSNTKLFGGILSMSAEKTAMIGYKGLFKSKPLVIAGWFNWIGTQIIRFLPRCLPPKMIKCAQQTRRKK